VSDVLFLLFAASNALLQNKPLEYGIEIGGKTRKKPIIYTRRELLLVIPFFI
jgi:hypothetical protein